MTSLWTTDPFTQVYEAIWTDLENSAELMASVKVNNRIKVAGDDVPANPGKGSISSSDVPEIAVLPASGSAVLHDRMHGASTIIQDYAVILTTGEKRASDPNNVSLFPLKWRILAALGRAGSAVEALAFVTRADVTDLAEDIGIEERARGLGTWSMGLTVSVAMDFSLSDFAEE